MFVSSNYVSKNFLCKRLTPLFVEVKMARGTVSASLLKQVLNLVPAQNGDSVKF